MRRESTAWSSPSFGRSCRHESGSALGHLGWNLLGGHDTSRPRARGADLERLCDHGGPAVGGDGQARPACARLHDELHDARDLLARTRHSAWSARSKQSELRLDPPCVLVRRDHGAVLYLVAGTLLLAPGCAGSVLSA